MGIEIDTNKLTVAIPIGKLQEIKDFCNAFKSKESCAKKIFKAY